MTRILIVGAGPAGLMAAEVAAQSGARVTVADAMPSFGRKFLMAGKSGLNITKDEADERFATAFPEASPQLLKALATFGPRDAVQWAEGLGQETFTGSSGRVFPKKMKASPLLRAWLGRLGGMGVEFRRRWRWSGSTPKGHVFDAPDGPHTETADAVVLALGGASWPRLGSNGRWAPALAERGVALAPFKPSNMGFLVDWSPHMAPHFGAPVKSVVLCAGDIRTAGEFVISTRGVEGGGIYAVSAAMREGAELRLDLAPDLPATEVAARLSRRRKGDSLSAQLRKTLKLDPVKRALLMEFARPLPDAPDALAALVKALPIRHAGPRPIEEAISTAGGVAWSALDDRFMLNDLPGIFCSGEMLDWEAPTGGYLITACLATGRAAAEGALDWLSSG